MTVDLFPTGTIRPGDVIEINGTRFELLTDVIRIRRSTSSSSITLTNTLTFFDVAFELGISCYRLWLAH